MSETPNITVPAAPAPAPKRPLWRRVLRIVDRVLAVIIILIALICLFFQTEWFRSLVISQIEQIVSEETNGFLSIGELGGNFLSGITLNDVQLDVNDNGRRSKFVFVKKISVRYSLLSLLSGKGITIKDIVLHSPEISLSRSLNDSLWNFERLIKPSPPSTDTTPFTQRIVLKSFRIENGTVITNDASDTSHRVETASAFRIGHSQFENIDLDMSARIDGDKFQEAALNHLSLKERSSGLVLYRLTTSIRKEMHKISIDTLILVTSKSTLAMKAAVDSLQLLGDDSHRKNVPFTLNVDAQAVSMKELAVILPSMNIFGGTPKLQLNVNGKLGSLRIRNANLDLGSGGKLRFAGSIYELHRPEEMRFDITAQGGGLSDHTMKVYLPGINAGDLRRYGTVTIGNIHYIGSPMHFSADLDISSSSAGSAKGTAMLDLRSQQPSYTADLTFGAVNAAAITADSSLSSNINLNVAVSGEGFDPRTMQTNFSVTSTGINRMREYALNTFAVSGSFKQNVLSLKNTEVVLEEGGSLRSEYALLDFAGKQLHYDISASLNDVPVSRYVPQLSSSSRVSLDAHLNGDGISAESVQGSIHAEIKYLRYRESKLDPVRIDMMLTHNQDGSRADQITGDIADIKMAGRYSFTHLVSELTKHLSEFTSAFNAETDQHTFPPNIIPDQDSLINANFSLHIKDLRPLDAFLSGNTVLAEGRLHGTISEQPDGALNIHSDGTLDRLLYKPPLTDSTSQYAGVRIYDTTHFRLSMTNMNESRSQVLDSLHIDLQVRSDSTIRVEGQQIHRPDISLALHNRNLRYHVNAGLQDIVRTYLTGGGSITDTTIDLPIDSIAVDLGNNFIWQSERSPFIRFDRAHSRIVLDTLTLYRPDLGYDPQLLLAQRLRFGIDLEGDSIRSFYFEAPQLKLRDIPLFFTGGERRDEYATLNGRISYLNITGNGKIADPTVNTSMLVRNVTYNDVTFDSCLMNMSMHNRTLRGVSTFHVDTAKFAVESRRYGRQEINLPSHNRFTVVVDSFPLEFTNDKRAGTRPFAIHASGNSYPLNMFSPFVPVVGDLHGLFDANIQLTGIGDSIQLMGDVKFSKSSFTVLSTNVRYNAEGTLSLTENELRFNEVTLRNQKDDDANGIATMRGTLAFTGFRPGKFDFTLATPRLTVLTNESKFTLKNVYGPLAMKTLSRPIRFYGTMEEPQISGDVSLVEGYLTLPQNVASAASIATGDIIYRTRIPENYESENLPDTLVQVMITESIYDIEDARSVRSSRSETVRSKEAAVSRQGEKQEIPFSEKLLYDMSISIPSDVWIDIYFNRALGLTGEQLNAELHTDRSLRLTRTQSGAPLQILGELSVTDRSSYKFIRDFNPVYGTLSFYKDITNPNLDLTAEYEGKHESRNDYYKVQLKITGTAMLPLLQIQMYKRNDVTGNYEKLNSPPDEQQTDALLFLAQGSLRSDLDDQQKFNAVNNLLNPIGFKFAGSLLNSLIGNTELSNYIRNVSFEEGSAVLVKKVKLTGGYQKLKINVGQQLVSTSDGSSDYTIELPASQFFSFPYANNLILFGEAHVLSASSQQTSILSKPAFGGSILIRIPF